MCAAVEREPDALLESGVQDVGILRIFANHVDVLIARQAANDGPPRYSGIVGNENVRTRIPHDVTIEGDVGPLCVGS